jgi:azurin
MQDKAFMKLIPYFAAVALLAVGGATAQASQTKPKPAAGSVRTITMTGTDNMKFSLTAIQAKPGEKLRVVLTTVGKMPKIAMAHNFVVLKKDARVDGFIQAAAMARATDFIPAAQKADVLAATGLAGAGEKVEVTFEAPKVPGSYPFVCSFPGHYALGMRGILTVK